MASGLFTCTPSHTHEHIPQLCPKHKQLKGPDKAVAGFPLLGRLSAARSPLGSQNCFLSLPLWAEFSLCQIRYIKKSQCAFQNYDRNILYIHASSNKSFTDGPLWPGPAAYMMTGAEGKAHKHRHSLNWSPLQTNRTDNTGPSITCSENGWQALSGQNL